VRDVSGKTFGTCDILRAGDGPHLGAVQRHDMPSNEPMSAAELNEGRTRRDDRFRIVVPEGADGVVVRMSRRISHNASKSRTQTFSRWRDDRIWLR
jgi:hypothetical protein